MKKKQSRLHGWALGLSGGHAIITMNVVGLMNVRKFPYHTELPLKKTKQFCHVL